MDIGQLSDAALLDAIGMKAPDGLKSMSDADLLKAVGQPQQNVSTLGDVAKSAGVGLGEGVLGLAGAPADLANLAAKGTDYLAGTNLQSYTQPVADYAGSNALQGYVEKATGPFYKPQTGAGEVAQTIGQFAPAAIGGPETLATRIGTRVVAPALASEAAGKLTEG